MNKKWKNVFITAMMLLFIAGLFLLLYPYLYGAYTNNRITLNTEGFLSRVELPVFVPSGKPEAAEPNLEADVSVAPTVPRKYPELWADMVAYNESLYETAQVGLSSEDAYEAPSFVLADYGLDSEAIGVLSVPALDFEMPIYLGATDRHLEDGVAHLSQTSLPIGGENTNTVIAGHRGWYGADFLRYIEKLKIGDEVVITNLWEELTYTVCEIKVIEPYQVEAVFIQPQRELLTLLTCHPYATGGRQRYLVICERTQS